MSDFEMEFAVWGAGTYGKRIYSFFRDIIKCYIDNNIDLYAKRINDKEVCSFEEYYKKQKGKGFILIAVNQYETIKSYLDGIGFHRYFIIGDCPSEVIRGENINIVMDYINGIKITKECAIKGINAYSIWLYIYI